MKKILFSLLAIVVLTAMVPFKKSTALHNQGPVLPTAGQHLTPAATGKAGPSVNGQGSITLEGRVQHFAFHATMDKYGKVSGSWESKSPGQDVRTHGTIDCMTLVDDQTAVLSGTITDRSGSGYDYVQVGDPIWFKVRDNGEGANNPPDEFTDYYILLSGCYDYGFAYHNIENGNIQVKP